MPMIDQNIRRRQPAQSAKPKPTTSQSTKAARARLILGRLQEAFARKLSAVSNHGVPFSRVNWLRDEGSHGGGSRLEAPQKDIFNRGSINFSHVHYDDLPDRALGSATALSAIIHPDSPLAPSLHLHISWTEPKASAGYWRVMADLNPAIERRETTLAFLAAFKKIAGPYYAQAIAEGDRYFEIPALGRKRGVAHFYLESFTTGNFDQDLKFSERFGATVIDLYSRSLEKLGSNQRGLKKKHRNAQLSYHSLYFFQVLTLDRGTTAGLLTHNQNDLGVMGSLPAWVDKNLIKSWLPITPADQQPLVQALIDALGPSRGGRCSIDEPTKLRLAAAVRAYHQN